MLALYCLQGTHADCYEVPVTLREEGRELGTGFTATLATREQAWPVWAGQVRRLRRLGYARIA